MSYQFYKFFHFFGIALLFTSLGGALVRGMLKDEAKNAQVRKLITISHGIALLLILVAGFGMLARTGTSMTAPWIYIKLFIWFLLGGVLALIHRVRGRASTVLWILLPILAAISGYVAISKPFTPL